MRAISLDLIRVTEAAAIAASKWIGSGNKEQADKAATEAIRRRLNDLPIDGEIAIGEGIKDKSYGLFEGEKVGAKVEARIKFPAYDIAVDPIEGTTPTVTSGPEAIATLAVGEPGSMYKTDKFYMKKLAYGKHMCGLSIDDPIDVIVCQAAYQLEKEISEIMVCILNRPRHEAIIDTLRGMGVRIKLIQDCDVSGAVATCRSGSGVDLLYGIGGAPEAVISAAAIKCLGGDFQSKEVNEDWSECGPTLHLEDLIKGPCAYVATGITDGSLLDGVRYEDGPITHSVTMRSESGTVRWIRTNHGN
jgi:fructose-1,6-bisphosphatase class II